VCIIVGYTMDTMYFTWLPGDPVEFDKGVELPQFTLQRWETNDCSQSYTAGTSPDDNHTVISFVEARADPGFSGTGSLSRVWERKSPGEVQKHTLGREFGGQSSAEAGDLLQIIL